MSKFYEQFITKDNSKLSKITQALLSLSLAIAVLSFALFRVILGVVFLVISIAIILIRRQVLIEYEYEYFQGELTLSKIIDKKSRKTIAVIKTKNIAKVILSKNLNEPLQVVVACFKGIENNKELILVLNQNNKKIGYFLSLDEALFNILKRENPFLFSSL